MKIFKILTLITLFFAQMTLTATQPKTLKTPKYINTEVASSPWMGFTQLDFETLYGPNHYTFSITKIEQDLYLFKVHSTFDYTGRTFILIDHTVVGLPKTSAKRDNYMIFDLDAMQMRLAIFGLTQLNPSGVLNSSEFNSFVVYQKQTAGISTPNRLSINFTNPWAIYGRVKPINNSIGFNFTIADKIESETIRSKYVQTNWQFDGTWNNQPISTEDMPVLDLSDYAFYYLDQDAVIKSAINGIIVKSVDEIRNIINTNHKVTK